MFDLEKANRVLTFVSHLTHTKGKWANTPFKVLDWQENRVIKPLFGTVKSNGLRQYRICYLEIPKKNGKTELGAALAIYTLTADGEASPEVYSAACDKDQASLLYNVAAQMVRNNEKLSFLKIRDSRKRIINPRNNGIYQVLSSDVRTKHGLNPSAVFFDEIHAQPNDELWRVLTSGTDYAREQQLVFVMTTAGVYNKESIWWRIREKARQIDQGIITDNSFLPILYIADPENDDPEDENLWIRVNPSLDRIFTLDRIREDYKTAKNNPIEYQDFLRFRLNIPIKQISRWLPMGAWNKCDKKIDEKELLGRTCYGGIDLSSTQDLTSFELVFPFEIEDELFFVVKSYFYCPEDTIMKRSKSDSVHYEIWAKQGFIKPTPGNYVDYGFIKRDVIEASEKYDLREVGYDPWNASQLAGELYNKEAIQMIEVRQGSKTLSEPSKDLLKKVLAYRIIHNHHPVLTWCADNLVMVSDANENIRPDKDKATDRIDGMVALIIAWSRAMFSGYMESVYDSKGITVF